MKRFLALTLILGVTSFGMVGCGGEESKVEEKTTVETPGGTAEVTKTEKVETTGDAPAVPPAAAPAPAEAK